MMFELIALGEVQPDFVSRRIQRFEGTNYSHVAVLVDGRTAYHAVGKGVQRIALDRLLADGPCVIRRRVQIRVDRDCCAKTWLESMVGKKYSLLQYLGFLFPFLRFISWVDNGRREVVCSEFGADFVMECSTYGAVAALRYGDSDFVGPRQALDVAAKLYGEQEYAD